MQIACDGIRTYTRSPVDCWTDFEIGSRIRKFIVYNNHGNVVAIGMCRGFNVPENYVVRVGAVTYMVSNKTLKTTLQEHIRMRIGWLHMDKTSVMTVTFDPLTFGEELA